MKATRDWWDGLWSDPIASTYEPSDVQALSRLATLIDERERAHRAVRKTGRLSIGSTGQVRLHPLLKLVETLDAEIRQLEDRFGLSPMARLKLGVQFGQAHRSLDELNRGLDWEPDEADPRLLAVVDK